MKNTEIIRIAARLLADELILNIDNFNYDNFAQLIADTAKNAAYMLCIECAKEAEDDVNNIFGELIALFEILNNDDEI